MKTKLAGGFKPPARTYVLSAVERFTASPRTKSSI
jgi:hypothetical protein